MGLASSQARLLNLTSRMHQIEYKAAKIEAEKLQMANKSKRVYQEYQNALERTKIQYKSIQTDGSATFIDANINILAEHGYRIICTDMSQLANILPNTAGAENSPHINSIDRLDVNTASNFEYTSVSTAQELYNVLHENSNAKIILMNDIDLSMYNKLDWNAINFSGELNGNGFKINNLNTSLFNEINNATIKNLGIECHITSSGQGAIANGSRNSTIDNCYVNGSISGESQAGAIVGWSEGISINSTYANVNVSASYAVGGFIGTGNDATITNSYVTGNITSNSSSQYIYCSGLVGKSYTGITVSNTVINTNGGAYAVAGGYGSYSFNNVSYNVSYRSVVDSTLYNTDGVTSMSSSQLNDIISSTYSGATISRPAYSPGCYDITDDIPNEYRDDSKFLTNLINTGSIILLEKNTKGEHCETSVATDTNLQEVADERELRKAEAKYEADMRQIDMKDRKFDYDLAALDAERNAIKSEMETLKTVAKDNVDRTFKLFG